MNEILRLNRRQFIASTLAAGGALVIGMRPAQAAMSDAASWAKPNIEGAKDFTSWLTIQPDDTVIVRVTAPDIGNGTLTQALSFVYEELGASWDHLKAEYASPNRDYREGGTFSKVGTILAYFSGRSTGPDRMAT